MTVHKTSKLNKKILLDQCKALGIARGDTIMVHAALHKVGEILGGPDVLIEALLECLGETGTMMVYVGCQMPFDDVGRGIFSAEDEQFILEHCPAFDPKTARASRDFGAFAELFRTTPGVICSENPGCRMAAIGAKAAYLTEGHPLNYGLGKGSPLEKFHNLGGRVLLLGSDLDAVTLLHYAEAVAPIANKKIVKIKLPLMRDGERVWQDVEEFNSSTGICDWPDDYFAQITRRFVEEVKTAKIGDIGGATSYLLDAQGLVEFGAAMMAAEKY